MKRRFIYQIFSVLIMAPFMASAQKLPNVQQAGLRAPDNIKIDGKAMEWNNQFRAYNKATDIYYTLSNNDENLYLTVQVIDPRIIEKTFAGGLTLTVKNPDKKNKTMPVMLTFPIIATTERGALIHKIKDPETNIETELTGINNQLSTVLKEIHIKGITGIDTIISVYNETGIKAVSKFDIKKAYTYELAIPLKYLQTCLDNDGGFNYNIRLNGLNLSSMTIVSINGKSVGANSPELAEAMSKIMSGNVSSVSVDANGRATRGGSMSDLLNPTDFDGEYTLAKDK